MKKAIAYMLALLMLAGLVPAAMAEEKALWFDDGLEITVFASTWAPHNIENEEFTPFPAIKEATNVSFKFDWRQQSDYNTQLGTLLSGGLENLPDLINPESYGIMNLANEGAIVPLDDYLAEYGQNIIAAVGEENMVTWRSGDGHIYTITGVIKIPGAMSNMIRKDWLDALGLAVPTTWDEYMTAWRAFRDNDCNGDGDPTNEIPLAYNTDANGEQSLIGLLNAFGIRCSKDCQFCVMDDGTYGFVYDHPRYREFLETMQQLRAEGILDSEFGSRDQSTLFTVMDSGLVGTAWTWAERASVSSTALRTSGDEDALWRTTVPIPGPYGDQNTYSRDWKYVSYCVSANVSEEKIIDIVKFFNWYFSEEGYTIANYGREGVTFDYVDGKPVMKPEVVANGFTSARELGLDYMPFPHYRLQDSFMQCLTKGMAYDDLAEQIQSFYDGLFVINEPYFYSLPPVLDTEAYVEYHGELIKNGVCVLRDQCIAGQISVDEFFEKYQELKDEGLQEVIDQGAAAYAVIAK